MIWNKSQGILNRKLYKNNYISIFEGRDDKTRIGGESWGTILFGRHIHLMNNKKKFRTQWEGTLLRGDPDLGESVQSLINSKLNDKLLSLSSQKGVNTANSMSGCAVEHRY